MVITIESVKPVKPKLAYEDYARLPDDERYELIDGELITMLSPKEIHQKVLKLAAGWFLAVEASGLGTFYFAPFDVILSNFNVVQPDIIFISNARSGIIFISNARSGIITEDNVRGAPDIVVEILSPSTADYDRTIKRELYERYGVPEYWLVDPYAKTITILRMGADGYNVHAVYGEGDTLVSPTLAGFALDLGELF